MRSPAQYIRGPSSLGFGNLQQRAVSFNQANEIQVWHGRVHDAVVERVCVRAGVVGQELGRGVKPGRVDDYVRSGGTPVREADLVALDAVDRWADVDEAAPDRTGKRVRDRDDVVTAATSRA